MLQRETTRIGFSRFLPAPQRLLYQARPLRQQPADLSQEWSFVHAYGPPPPPYSPPPSYEAFSCSEHVGIPLGVSEIGQSSPAADLCPFRRPVICWTNEGLQNVAPSQPPSLQPMVVHQQSRRGPPRYYIWSCFSLLFCFWPLGLAALVYAAKAHKAANYECAVKFSKRAMMLNIAATVIGPVLILSSTLLWTQGVREVSIGGLPSPPAKVSSATTRAFKVMQKTSAINRLSTAATSTTTAFTF